MHILLIDKINNYDMCLEQLELFLPYIDNWATCDMVSLKILSKNRDDFLKHIKEWINSDHIYTIRLGVNMLMNYYLDDSFRDEFLLWVSQIKCNDYYVNMIISWFFATALVKQYCSAIIYLENRVLSSWRHNKTIQKAIESYRISDDVKKYLRSLKV